MAQGENHVVKLREEKSVTSFSLGDCACNKYPLILVHRVTHSTQNQPGTQPGRRHPWVHEPRDDRPSQVRDRRHGKADKAVILRHSSRAKMGRKAKAPWPGGGYVLTGGSKHAALGETLFARLDYPPVCVCVQVIANTQMRGKGGTTVLGSVADKYWM